MVIHRPPFQLIEHLLAGHLALQLAIGKHYRSTSAGSHATSGHQADLAVFCGLALWNSKALFSGGHKLVGPLDVARRAGTDGHGVLARRLETEVVVEGDHAVCLAERHAQGAGHKADRVVVKIPERRLDSVQRLNQCVAGKPILAHGAVHDLPTFVVAG
jgi:hypothetical protein